MWNDIVRGYATLTLRIDLELSYAHTLDIDSKLIIAMRHLRFEYYDV